MTLPSENDRLVEFLHRHRPVPPVAPADLEHQIMAAVEQVTPSNPPVRRDRPWQQRWALPALAASLLVGWGSWATLRSPSLQSLEQDEIETFLTDTWYGATYGDDTLRLALDTTQPDWVFSVYATPY